MTDEQLLAAVQGGDTRSLGTLFDRWERPLYRFVSRMLPRHEDARDVCQETFLRILKKSHRFRSGSRFSTWMYQIALNLCRDQLRRRRRWSLLIAEKRDLPDHPGEESSAIPRGSDPDARIECREKSAAVLAALREIPTEQREVLILKEFQGLKFREIAEILDLPASTVKSRMYYGLHSVRTALARQGISGP